jgi:ion channel POLLUX/CASTOR
MAPTVRQRLRYAFDNTMSRGTPALVGWLGLATLFLVLVFTALVVVTAIAPPDDAGNRESFWRQLLRTLFHTMDPGTIGGDDFKWPYIIVMLIVTIGGIFIVSALIGVIATAFDTKLEELRKGRSFVVEKDHTLVLGWSEAIYTIVAELAIANENEKNPVVVVMADRDKVEMEESIRAKVGDTGRTRVVCRNGSPIDLSHLDIVNPRAARSIIVLSSADEEPDADVIKTVLALTQNPNRRVEPYHIVAEIEHSENLEAARIVGGEETTLIDKGQTIARLIVQASRQSGVSVAYTDLLDFSGDEIYFRHDPALAGKTFGDALLAYEECSVIGIRSGTTARVNPSPQTVIGETDEVIAIAADDSALAAAVPLIATIQHDAITVNGRAPEPPQRVLVLGWNARSPIVLRELDEYLVAGSTVTVVAQHDGAAAAIEAERGGLENLTVDLRPGNTTERRTLDSLDLASYDNVIVMCYSDQLDAQKADSRTLVTLLHLRDMSAKTGKDFAIVSEMLDDRNRELAQVTNVDDVIVSEKLISLIIAQISENPALADVFTDLFDASGSEIYLRPIADYVAGGSAVTFATLVEAARRRNEAAIGYRIASGAGDPTRHFGVVMNPSKSTQFTPADGDRLIVLAEG